MKRGKMAQSLEGPYQLAGKELSTPLFNAAGAMNDFNPDRILEYARELAKTDVGAHQYGSITIPPSPGNEAIYGPPTEYYDEETREMSNSKGLPNPGKEVTLRMTPELVSIAHEAGKLAIFSVSPTKDAGDSVEQAVELVHDFLETDADLVVVNVGCPNIVTEGSARKPIMGYDVETMHRLVDTFWTEFGMTDRLGVKTANHVTREQQLIVPQIADFYRDYPVFSWMETPNTIPGHVPRDKTQAPRLSVPGGMGGLSGPATKKNGREQFLMWHRLVGDFMDVVRTQGVDSGKELAWSLGHGAVAASGVTFLHIAKSWPEAVDKMLTEFVVEIEAQNAESH